MVYKVTILKDLPSIPAGYSFCYEEGGRGKGPVIFELNNTKSRYISESNRSFLIDAILWHSKNWMKIEPLYQNLVDLRCPYCGNPYGIIRAGKSNPLTGNPRIKIEYSCGHGECSFEIFSSKESSSKEG